jgi:VIT1/CCC1 family predicted Fe2+/Mn2+ transporter
MELEKHYIFRSGWLRVAVPGANDEILATTILVIGVAAASHTRDPIILAAIAGLVVGALSLAAREYLSSSSQSNAKTADPARAQNEIATTPNEEPKELAEIY